VEILSSSIAKLGRLLSALLIYVLWQAIWGVPALAQIPVANTSSRGAWSSADIYQIGAVVEYGAGKYIALTKNVCRTPDSSRKDWAILDPGTRSSSEKTAAAELRGPAAAARAGGTAALGGTYARIYVAGTRYSVNDVVTEKGTTYIAVVDGAREDPAIDVAFSLGSWAVISAQSPRWTARATGTASTVRFNGLKNSTTPDGLQRSAELTAEAPKHPLQAQDAFPGCTDLDLQLDPFYRSEHLGADCGTTIRTRTDYSVIGGMLFLSLLK